MKKEEFVTLAKFSSADRARLMKTLLDSMGVASQVINDTAATMVIPPISNSVRLVVNADDYDRAKEALEAKFDKKEFMVEARKK